MTRWRKVLSYGFLIWVIAFVVAFFLYPVRESNRPLFESIMPVVLALSTAVLGVRYFRGVTAGHRREGLVLGSVWLLINVGVDLPLMLTPSPMQMGLDEYLGDIGLTYLVIPTITVAIGAALGQRVDRHGEEPEASSGR